MKYAKWRRAIIITVARMLLRWRRCGWAEGTGGIRPGAALYILRIEDKSKICVDVDVDVGGGKGVERREPEECRGGLNGRKPRKSIIGVNDPWMEKD